MVKSIQNKEDFPCLVDPTGKEHYLQLGTAILGRSLNCGVIIADERISRENSQIFLEGFLWFIEELKSTNGTYLNNERITKIMTPRDGDLIQVGNTTFSFRDPESTKADLSIPDLVIDSKEGFVCVNRKIVFVSPKENSLLVFLYNHRPDYCSKDSIRKSVWPEYQPKNVFDYQIENLVRRLRKRLEIDPDNPQLLISLRRFGYKVNLPYIQSLFSGV